MFTVPPDAVVPYDEFEAYLQEGTKLYLDRDLLIKSAKSLGKIVETRKQEVLGLIFAASSRRYDYFTHQIFIDYLIEIGTPPEFFCKRGGDEPKYFNDKVRDKIIAGGYVTDGYLLHQDYSKKKYLLDAVNKYIDRDYLISQDLTTNRGTPVLEIDYSVKPIDNLRFTTSNQNVIGFTGPLQEAICAPEGYYILSCDFPQIDARSGLNMYLKNSKMVELSTKIEDTYLLYREFARYVQHQKDLAKLKFYNSLNYYTDVTDLEKRIEAYNPNIKEFSSKSERAIYKVTALKTLYFSRFSAYAEERKAISYLASMYNASERYSRMVNIGRMLYENGIPLRVTSRWKTMTKPIMEQYYQKTMQVALNAPVQATSSEVVIFFCNRFLDYFRKLGIGPDGVRFCMNRHDEPVFYIKKEVFHQHIQHIASMRTCLIEGWQPFELEMYVGYSYKKNDEFAKSLLDRIPSDYPLALIEAEKHKDFVEDFPLAEPKIVYGKWAQAGGKIFLALMWYEGELVDELNLEDDYMDRRMIKTAILTRELKGDTLATEDVLDLLTSHVMSDNGKYDEYLFNFEGTSVRAEHTLAGAFVYLRSSGGEGEKNIVRGILATVLRNQGFEVSHHEDNFINALARVSHRISM